MASSSTNSVEIIPSNFLYYNFFINLNIINIIEKLYWISDK